MKTVDIRVFKDNLVDGPKTFTFRLSEPSSGDQLVEGQSSAWSRSPMWICPA